MRVRVEKLRGRLHDFLLRGRLRLDLLNLRKTGTRADHVLGSRRQRFTLVLALFAGLLFLLLHGQLELFLSGFVNVVKVNEFLEGSIKRIQRFFFRGHECVHRHRRRSVLRKRLFVAVVQAVAQRQLLSRVLRSGTTVISG